MGRGATLLLKDTTLRIELVFFLAHRNLVVALGIKSPKNVDTGYDPCQFAGEQGLPSNLSKVVHNPLLSPSWWNLKMMVSKKNLLFPQCPTHRVKQPLNFGSMSTLNRSYCAFFRLSPFPVTVTTRNIPFLVGDPYKPSFATVTGRGDNPMHSSDSSVYS